MNSRQRRRVIAEWRGYHEPPPPDRNLCDLRQALEKWGPALGLAQGVDEEEVANLWGQIVGPFLSRHSTPKSLRHGVLTVRVSQPSVRFALEQGQKSEMLRKLQDHFGNDRISSLRFTTI